MAEPRLRTAGLEDQIPTEGMPPAPAAVEPTPKANFGAYAPNVGMHYQPTPEQPVPSAGEQVKTIAGGVRDATSGFASGAADVLRGTGENAGNMLRTAFPDTRAAFTGAGEDIARNLRGGNYIEALNNTIRGATVLPLALGADTIRGAYQTMRGSAETASPSAPQMAQPAASPQGSMQPTGGALPLPGPGARPESIRGSNANGVAPTGDVTRIGNSYSGTDVKEGFRMQDSAGNPLTPRGSVGSYPGAGSLMDSGSNSAARMNAIAQGEAYNNSLRQQLQDGARPGVSATPGTMVIGSAGYDRPSDREPAKYTPPSQLRAQELAQSKQNSAATIAATLRSQDIAARGQDQTAATAMRGQDITQQGNALANQSANTRLRYDMGKDNRDHAYKVGQDTQKQRTEADDHLTKELHAQFVTKNDKGEMVPDLAAVASMKGHLDAYQSHLIKSAEARGDTKTADAMRDQGLASLGKDGLQRAIKLAEVKQKSAANHSNINAFGGSHIDHPDLERYAPVEGKDGVKRGIFQDQYKLAGGSEMPVRALSHTKGTDRFSLSALSDSPTTRYEDLFVKAK